MELKDYFQILVRRKWIVLITVAATLLIVIVGTVIQTPVYQSSVTLRVAVSSSGQLSYSSTSYAAQLLNTTAQIATSGPVLDELMKRLNLTVEPKVTSAIISNTELIKITVEDQSPATAAAAASTLGDILIEESYAVYTGGAITSKEVLAEQLAQSEADILETRHEYDQALLETPAATEKADLLYQSLLLQQRNYDSLQTQYQDSVYQEEMRANMITVVENPLVPTSPSSPVLSYNLLLGVVVGLLGGIILAFLIDNFDTTLFNSRDIEMITETVALTRIPKVKASLMGLSNDGSNSFSDAFRDLAMKIQRMSSQRPMNVLLMCSAEPGQGKSMITAHLAVSLAELKKKVVVVDCDLRLPMIHTWFNLPNEAGLKDVLDKGTSLDKTLQKTGFEKLYVLTSGEIVEKPSLLLGSQRMQKLIEILKRRFDYVILDTPALLAVGDAAVISDYADALFLVASREKTKREALQLASNFLKNNSGKYIGLIINQEKDREGYYYRRSPKVNFPFIYQNTVGRNAVPQDAAHPDETKPETIGSTDPELSAPEDCADDTIEIEIDGKNKFIIKQTQSGKR